MTFNFTYHRDLSAQLVFDLLPADEIGSVRLDARCEFYVVAEWKTEDYHRMALIAAGNVNLGFLTVLHEANGYVGGFLATNSWGRPLEFRLSSAVQANKIQQILYGPTLEPYLCSDLIGKKLLEKTTTPVKFVFTDHPAVLDLRLQIEIPVGLVSGGTDIPVCAAQTGMSVPPGLPVTDKVCCHGQFAQDVAGLRTLLEQLSSFDLSDPFVRIREALAEARKLGVAHRAA